MSLRSPLGKVLGKGSAKQGTEHFWGQRLSAAALVVLGLWFAVSLLQVASLAHAELIAWIAAPWNSVLLVLMTGTLAWHSSLGVQIVIEDYVHGPFVKMISLVLSKFAHIVVAAAIVFAVLRIAFTVQG